MPVAADLRYALRVLRTNPAFAAAAIVTLALGISVNTTIFSIVDGVLLRPLPYRDAGRLALLWTTAPRQNAFELPTGYLNIQDWRHARSFDAMAFYRDDPVVLREEPEPEALEVSCVSPDFFDLVGVRPALGRFFTASEAARGERLAVLSFALWQRRFGGSPSVLGRVLHIEGRQATVIGVLRAGFRPLSQATELWMPYSSAAFFDDISTWRYSKFGWNVLAHLRPGVTTSEAQVEMDGISARLGAAFPDANQHSGVRVVRLLDQVTAHIRLALELLLAAVVLVLLIACTNVGNLLLARAAGREPEMAVRAALGASRAQLLCQLLAESAVLSLAAAALGFALASIALRIVVLFAPAGLPRLDETSLDLRALAFTVAISLGSALLFGAGPAWRLAGKAVVPAPRSVGGSHSMRSFRRILVIGEYALAIVLLSGTGLLVRSLASVLAVDPGFHAAGVLTVELHSPAGNDPMSPPRFQQLTEQIEAVAGVDAAGGISRYFQANAMLAEVSVDGEAPLDQSHWRPVNYDVIAGRYLQAVGIPLLRGRYFLPSDGPGAPQVAIVNDAFVRAFIPHRDPIGITFRRGGDRTGYTIVGVIGDTRRQDITAAPIPEVFWPHTQRPWGMNLAVRTSGDPLALAATVRGVIHRVDGTAVIKKITTLDRQMDSRVAQRRFQTGLLAAFAALALLLAAFGIYGLMHFSVAERTQEIGVRMALGARPRDIFALVLHDALRLACAGMAVGLAAALWASRLLASLLYGVTAHDPLTYVGALAVLAGAAALAAAVPAGRASACDPQAALRRE